MSLELGKLIRTIWYIKPIQAIYQLKNRLLPVKYDQVKDDFILIPDKLDFIPLPFQKNSATEKQYFTFLNLSISFDNQIIWNFEDFGKLWNYNLQYLDYILQENIAQTKRVEWVLELYKAIVSKEIKFEPYPVSLRSINVIRFLSKQEIDISQKRKICGGLHSELSYLHSNYEYHLLGNHLLENAFAMLMGGYFFNNQTWKNKAEKVLLEQMDEQILSDGAHFEISPMYHQIILWRILESLSYISKDTRLYSVLRSKAEKMLAWLRKISFSNGDIPHFNDSANNIAFTTKQLTDISDQLGLRHIEVKLADSGYRKFHSGPLELIIDVNSINPVYQPGHNHADSLSFILYLNDLPFIVDPGISTYNISERRQWERSSRAHNTVTVNNHDQSEVWGGFRIGRRAKLKVLKDVENEIFAEVNYKINSNTIKHSRNLKILKNSIKITDNINYRGDAIMRFYLHPQAPDPEIFSNRVTFKNGISLIFDNSIKIVLLQYEFAEEFNKLLVSNFIEVLFKDSCNTIIKIS